MRERKNVYKLPAGDTTLEWYARAVIEMKKRPSTDPTSWNYQAAMHGFNAGLPAWRTAAPFPGLAEQADYWNQCQHGSWFFLPWHRMYLAYFEQIVTQTIVKLGGPASWALPFWDYSDQTNPHARTIPPAFTNPASATNGLWVAGRQNTTVPERYVSIKALGTIPYTGDGITAPLGFGGPQTPFSHRGGIHGELESLPHDTVHGVIGGIMGDPRTAALDPVFWLHHANIDRLWQVWLNKGQQRANPKTSAWLDFKFSFRDATGAGVEMKCSSVQDTRNVLTGYTYQGVQPAAMVPESIERAILPDFTMPLDVIAATNVPHTLGAAKETISLKLNVSPKEKLNVLREAISKPKTTFLHFENITGKGVPPVHDVYLNTPEDVAEKRSYYAGAISFFGVEESSVASAHHSGSGQHYAFDISDLMTGLRGLPGWKEQELKVTLEPIRKMEPGEEVTIGRISLYSE